MIVRGAARRSAYHDSAALMRVQQALRGLRGIAEAGVVMATPANLDLLRQAGLDPAAVSGADGRPVEPGTLGPNDLVIMVRGATAAEADAALGEVDALLARRPAPAGESGYRPQSIATAARALAGANLALISVPGRFAAGAAGEAMRAGLHVMVFSDNVPVADEVRLKREASAAGRIVMGPDCGTALLAGAALGFANRVRRGPIGVVGASGTGIQEITTLVHHFGGGISHAIGTGGRDLSAEVGGIAARQGLALLSRDPGTEVVVIVSKPPAPEVAAALLGMAAAGGKPVVTALAPLAGPGAAAPRTANIHSAGTLEDAARLAVSLASGAPRDAAMRTLAEDRTALAELAGRARHAIEGLGPSQRYLRGLMSGGTLCAEAVRLLEGALRPLYTNLSSGLARRREGAGPSRDHTILDLGDDLFTVGRLHPMLDMTLRASRLRQEAADPDVAVLLLDVVLGLGVHPDPAGALAPVIADARAAAQQAGRELAVVASVCGTDEDPQRRSRQVAALVGAGVLVEASNARAALLAGAIAARAPQPEAIAGMLAAAAPPAEAAIGPGHGPLPPDPVDAATLIAAPPHVVNVGLALFAESLREQEVPVIEVDWRPPAGGDADLLSLLERLT
jgi:FdrA protein